MKTIIRKRVIAIILSLTLVLAGMTSLGNTETFAADDYAASIILPDGTETKYTDFNDALNAWVSGSTLKLLKIISIDAPIKVSGSGVFTLDLSRYGILQTHQLEDEYDSTNVITVDNTKLNIINSATEDYGKEYYLGIDQDGRAVSYSKLNNFIGKEGETYIKVPCGFLAGGATYNKAFSGSGLFICNNAVVTLDNISIAGNIGGGIEVLNNSTLTVKGDSKIIYNKGYNGGIYANESIVNLTDKSAVKYNSASFGGGIASYYSTITLDGNAEVSYNQVNSDTSNALAGGIYAYESALVIKDKSQVSNNSITTKSDDYENNSANGGGIYIVQGTVNVSDNARIGSNTITSSGNAYGGGICAYDSNVNIDGLVTIDDNSSISKGVHGYFAIAGGIYTYNCTLNIAGDTSVAFNVVLAEGEGCDAAAGGIAAYGNTTVKLSDDVTIYANSVFAKSTMSSAYGGGISSGKITLQDNVEIFDNEVISVEPYSAYAGGIFIHNNDQLAVSGKASVYGNIAKNNKVDTDDNVYIYNSQLLNPISVIGALTGKINIIVRDNISYIKEGVFATAIDTYNNGAITETDIAAFTCDDPDCKIILNDGGQAELVNTNKPKIDPAREELPDTVIGWPRIFSLKNTLLGLRDFGTFLGEYVIVDQDHNPVVGENTYTLKYVPYNTDKYNTIENITWTFTFKINIADQGVIFGQVDDYVEYTGKPAHQIVDLSIVPAWYEWDGEDDEGGACIELIEGIDYIQECSDINVGKATTTIKGVGDYGGEFKLDFEIIKGTPIPEELPDTWDKNPWLIENHLYDLSQEESSKGQYMIDSDYYTNGITYLPGINDIHLRYIPKDKANYNSIDVIWHVNLTHTECNMVLEETILKEATPEAPGEIFSRYICPECGYWGTAESYPYYLDVNDCTYSTVEDVAYTGSAIHPDLSIKYNDYVLTESKDYTVECNDINVGKATVTIKGCGNFTGEKKIEFNIKGNDSPVGNETPTGNESPTSNQQPTGTQEPAGTQQPTGTDKPTGTGTTTGTETPISTSTPAGTSTVTPTGTSTGTSTGTTTGTSTGTSTGTTTGTDTPTGTGSDTATQTDYTSGIKTEEPVSKGSVVSDESANADYEVTASGKKKNTVEFNNYDGNSSAVEIPDAVIVNNKKYNVTSLDANAFAGNTGLKKLVLNDKITKILKNSFEGCTGLKKLVLSDNTKIIGANALNGCTALTSLNIPARVEHIRKDAFAGCENLKKLVIRSNKFTNESEIKNMLNNLSEGCTLAVPKDMKATYKKLLKDLNLTKSIRLKAIKNS